MKSFFLTGCTQNVGRRVIVKYGKYVFWKFLASVYLRFHTFTILFTLQTIQGPE